MFYDAIIVGAGVSGMMAAINLKRGGRNVLLLEKENAGGQAAISPRLENVPGFKEISGEEYAFKIFEQVLDLGIDFELEEVLIVQKEHNIFTVQTNYRTYQSYVVIIASGVKHRHLGLDKEESLIGKGISYCAVCDGAFYKDKDVILIGDANSAMQYALSLAKTSRQVTICALFDKLFADQILIERVKNTSNIHLFYNLSAQEILGENVFEGVIFKNTKTKELIKMNADGLFIAIGQIPDNERYKNLVDLKNGFIVVNDEMETKTQGLFASGDCIDKKYRQIVLAENDGAIASISALNYLNKMNF